MVANIFTWWVVVQVVGIIGLPITTFLFRTLPDRGYAFSKSLGILLISYGAWMLAMLGLAPFGVPLLVFVAFLVGIIGVVLITYVVPRSPGETPMASYVQTHWRGIVAYEGLFLLSLIALAWLRAHNPDPWGTERPMDYGFFNAIQHSRTFPPHDPWLAGYSINYYYFGYLMHAAIAMVSGLQPSVAFNLSLALVFALTALNVAGVVANLIALTPSAKRQDEPDMQKAQPKRPPLHLLTRPLVALLGVVLVLIAANQSGALQVFVGNYKVVALDGEQFMSALKQGFSDAEEIELPHPLRTNDFGTLTALDRNDQVKDFNWWWPSRSLWDSQPLAPTDTTNERIRIYNITEFPFFSFWLGDMHPHVMALPYGLLAMALTLATLARPRLPMFATNRQSWADLVLTGLVLGSLYVINSWDLPTYWLLYAGALFVLAIRQAGHSDAVLWGKLVWQMVLVTLALYILFLPFYLTFHSLVGSADPLTKLPILSKLTTIIAPYKAGRTEIHAYLTIFGLFVLPVLVFAYLNQRQPKPTGTRPPLIPGLPWLAPALLIVGLLIKFPLLALAGVALFVLDLAMRRADATAEAFVLLVILLGCCICFGTELIFIRDVFSNRMNTIFKFYYQVWLLWGTITAYIVWWVWKDVVAPASSRPEQDAAAPTSSQIAQDAAAPTSSQIAQDAVAPDSSRPEQDAVAPTSSQVEQNAVAPASSQIAQDAVAPASSRTQAPNSRLLLAMRGVFTVIFVALLAGSLVYPGINVRDMLRNDTLEGLVGKTPRERTPAGEESIAWLRDNALPGSVLLEMVGPGGGSYNPQGYAGVSASTGIPTVLGWIGHENQWRGGHKAAKDEIGPRQSDVDTMYSTLDIGQLRSLLEQYGITYIYVGMLEREGYVPESLAKFAQVGDVVFQQGEVTIYRVRR